MLEMSSYSVVTVGPDQFQMTEKLKFIARQNALHFGLFQKITLLRKLSAVK